MKADNVFCAVRKDSQGRIYKNYKRVADMTEEELKTSEPVLLEYVLEELGWSRRGCVNNFHAKLGDYYIQWSNSEQLRYLLKIRYTKNDDYLHIHNVKYLHQLQNLFEAFTGTALPNTVKLLNKKQP